ncbi:EF-hand domain-containing protein [Kitasatospora sp. NPDC048365]|uniref:EF-hand domain-containing protein n=1 Tax=Kitasatospora sp. NPDC048365 TaxID=3364050 RepID=UPI00371DB39A
MGTYRMRVLQLFDLIDTNKNGYIDPGDLPHTDGAPGSAEAQRARIVETLIRGAVKDGDSNKDSRVTKDEMLHHVERTMVGNPYSAAPAYIRDVTAKIFALMDADGNGKVSKDEFERYLKAGNATDPGAAGEFARLDRDGDGALTIDDLNHATHRFFTAPETDVPEHWLLAALTT